MSANKFSTESPANLTDEININSELQNRYAAEGLSEEREQFKQRLESIMTETMEKEAELLAEIDAELTRLKLSPQETTAIGPSEFLDFVLSADVVLHGKSKKTFDRSKYKVTDDYLVLFNENDEDEKPFYVLLGGKDLAFCRFLAQRGVDIIHSEESVLRELLSGKAFETFSKLADTIHNGEEEAKTIVLEERDSYARDLKQELSFFIESAVSQDSTIIDTDRLKEIFDLYQHIPSRFTGEQYSLEPEFNALIDAKKSLTPENVSVLNNFLETNEELIFEVLGEDYFFELSGGGDSFEDDYREMFGYTGKEIWERRKRNWENVNKYLTDEVAARGYLTVDDLRQIHILSTKGVLPFFCQGFRNDRNIGWYQAEHFKETVTIGKEVRTTEAVELDAALELLVSKANRVAKAGYPKVMAEVAWGNLFAEYATMHPHPDGNGTNDVFFIEAIKVLDGGYTPPQRYEQDYKTRVKNTLNNNVLAVAVAYTQLTAYEMTHKNKRQ
ncbi:hypothetical protein GYA27_02810 [candidate division WWE3 bacterium]|uniref:Fido domain-containing protein n=1 Tax=candidate division WWE3 bacterium TaxID=2053526 RepID=A0A7X9DKX8_UNCKA|nr:hypothetical protein [candidate division WWE3 bacterium]